MRGRADRIRAADLFAVERRAQRQILSVREPEPVAEIGRNIEGDGDRVARLALDARNAQRMERARVARLSDT